MKTTQLHPYLFFDGNCREAMNFYQTMLGGSLELSSMADMQTSEASTNIDDERIMHARLVSGDFRLMASDIIKGQEYSVGNNVHLSLLGSNESKLRALFLSFAEHGGKVDLPLEKQFWGDIFGMVTDKYGVHWLFNITTEEAADVKN